MMWSASNICWFIAKNPVLKGTISSFLQEKTHFWVVLNIQAYTNENIWVWEVSSLLFKLCVHSYQIWLYWQPQFQSHLPDPVLIFSLIEKCRKYVLLCLKKAFVCMCQCSYPLCNIFAHLCLYAGDQHQLSDPGASDTSFSWWWSFTHSS